MNLNDYARACHDANLKWWTDAEGNRIERNNGELFCLIHSEISEAMEGERKSLKDDKLPHRPMAEVEIVDALIRIFDYCGARNVDLSPAGEFESLNHFAQMTAANVETDNRAEALNEIHNQIARVYSAVKTNWRALIGHRFRQLIRYITGYAGKFGHDLDGAFAEKMAYNATRYDHTHEARAQAHGKKF